MYLVLSETKLDDTYLSNQFQIEGFSLHFRADRNDHGGGLLIYVRDEILCKILTNQDLPSNVEAIFIELNLKNSKWLLMSDYNPHKDSSSYFLSHISKVIDANLYNYENFILLGDCNAVDSDLSLTDFCELYNLKNLKAEPTCYKNPNNPSLVKLPRFKDNRDRAF